MISIDTVYQKVLAFANKEQRGYITPQEFNLFAHQAQVFRGSIDYEILSTKDWNDSNAGSPLIAPTATRPTANISNSNLKTNPTGGSRSVLFFVKPEKPNWSYVVVNEKAMYDSTNATDFELHPSEETELVYKILKYAGISMQRQDAAQAGQSMEATMKQQQSKIQ